MQKSMIRLLSIADMISLLNAIFGFLAIIMLFLDEVRFAFAFILLALMADGLDGAVARKLGHSKIGDYLESMADMTTTGISVSIFIYVTYQNIVSDYIYYHIAFIAVLILYLSTNIIRLASFTTMKEKNIFVGLPAPASAIVLLMLTFLNVGFVYILAGLVIISFLLISNIRFPKPSFKIDAMAAVLIILTLVLWENYYNIAPLLLLTSLVLYAVIGPVYLLKHK